MRRYFCFSGQDYYPCGGMHDFDGDFDTLESAKEAVQGDWAHILDTRTGKEYRRFGDSWTEYMFNA